MDATPGEKSDFSAQDRERIRSTLIRYMKEHGIGVPTLGARIAKATDRPSHLIPIKTLQRFLAGSHRTYDVFVGYCHTFIGTLPPAQTTDPLLAFLQLLPGASAIEDTTFPENADCYIDDNAESPTFYSVLHVLPSAGAALAIRETILNPARKPGVTAVVRNDKSAASLTYEGLLINLDGMHIAVLRSPLSGRPRVHCITRLWQSGLVSSCHFIADREGEGLTRSEHHTLTIHPSPHAIDEPVAATPLPSDRESKGRLAKTRKRFASPDPLVEAALTFEHEEIRRLRSEGSDPAGLDPETGLSVLHVAVGTNNLALVRLLIEEGKAPIGPDRQGRWPTLIAAECCASEELCDYIAEKEADELGRPE